MLYEVITKINNMNKEKKANLLLKIILILIAILPLIYFYFIRDVSYKAFIFGTGSWGIGLIFKMTGNQLLIKRISNKNKSQLIISLANGFFSGFFELSASYLVILLVV